MNQTEANRLPSPMTCLLTSPTRPPPPDPGGRFSRARIEAADCCAEAVGERIRFSRRRRSAGGWRCHQHGGPHRRPNPMLLPPWRPLRAWPLLLTLGLPPPAPLLGLVEETLSTMTGTHYQHRTAVDTAQGS